MNPHMASGLALVLLTTAAVFALGWQTCLVFIGRAAPPEDEQRAPMPTYRGWVEGSSWGTPQGAADPVFQMMPTEVYPRQPDPLPSTMTRARTFRYYPDEMMDLASAGYALGQQSASAEDTRREVDAIWADIESNPQKWRHQ